MALLRAEFVQTQRYSALRDRLALAHGGELQAGVWGQREYLVQAQTSADMTVRVDAGYALVQATNANNGGLYHIENDGTVNVSVSAADIANPRVDQLVLTARDSVHGGDFTDIPVLQVVAGTPTAGTQIRDPSTTSTYRRGAAALPANSLRLADILVGTSVTRITSTDIIDRRPWARGALAYGQCSSNFGVTGTTSFVTSSSWPAVSIETSGVPIRLTVAGSYILGNVLVSANTEVTGALNIDGLPYSVNGNSSPRQRAVDPENLGTQTTWFNWSSVLDPVALPAGRHSFQPTFRISESDESVTVLAGAQFYLEEIVRPFANNN